MNKKEQLIEVVARCLAIQDDRFIAASDWVGSIGQVYRQKATHILLTIDRFNSGIQSGGLP